MQISDKARDILKEILAERNAAGIRVYFGGFGWGGPQIGLALEEPEEDDHVTVINEIQVAIESNIVDYTQGMALEYDEYREGLVLMGGDGGCW